MRIDLSPDEINEMIPMPVMVKIPTKTLGQSGWKQIWTYLSEPTKYKLVGNWFIHLPNGMKLMFPDGFEFDGASIPWYLRWMMTSFGPLLRGAIVHDFGYRYNFLFRWDGNQIAIERGKLFFDDLFKDIVLWTTGIVALANVAWAGIRAGGDASWNKHREEEL